MTKLKWSYFRDQLPKIILLGLLIPNLTFASVDSYGQKVSASFGMVSVSVAENPSDITPSDPSNPGTITAAENTSESFLSMELSYQFLNWKKSSLAAKLITPLITSNGTGYFMAGLNFNYYFNSIPSNYKFNNLGMSLIVVPKFQYYVGGYMAAGYLIYTTTSEKKSDIMLDISLLAGASYRITKKMSLKGEASFGRGFGVITTTTPIKFFVGVTYPFEI